MQLAYVASLRPLAAWAYSAGAGGGASGSNMKSLFWSARSAAVAVALVAAAPAAQAQQPYFVGQTIEIISPYSEGNEGNSILQEYARAWERLWPGTRAIVRGNAGGSAALAGELLYNAAPDGLTIGIADIDTMLARATGEEMHDASEFALIGAMARRQTIIFGGASAGIDSLDDLYNPVVQPVRATTSNSRITSQLVNALLGTRIQAVTGYSSSEADLAFISGEGGVIIEDIVAGQQFLDDATGTPLLLLMHWEEKDLPAPYDSLPGLSEIPGAEEFAWVPPLLKGLAYGRSMGAPAAIDAARLADLRMAFDAIMADPGFQAAVAPLWNWTRPAET